MKYQMHHFIKNFKLLTVLLALFLCFSSFKIINERKAPPEADNLINPLLNNVGAAKKGRKIYQKLCSTCHGKFGKGDGPASKNLKPSPTNHTSAVVQKQTDGAIYWKISKGNGVMPPFKSMLSKTQRWQLVNYIRVLGNKNS